MGRNFRGINVGENPKMSVKVPRIETERLLLRGRTMADFDAFAAIWGDPEVARFTSGVPLSREDSWRRFACCYWDLVGCGSWIVVEKANGRVIGDACITDFKRNIEPSLDGKPECGWVFAPSAQGKGYAIEAMRAALKWADENFPGATFSAIIDPGNVRSIRVAEKLGFREAARTTYKAKPASVYYRGAEGRAR